MERFKENIILNNNSGAVTARNTFPSTELAVIEHV